MAIDPVTADEQGIRRAPASAHPGVLPGGYGRTALVVGPTVPNLVRGRGAYVEDEHGNRLIDANMNFAVLVLGHAHPDVVRAAGSALEHGSCYGLAHRAEARLGEVLVDRIAHAEQIKFTNSGTEAVMLACRLARAVTGRDLVVGIEGAYHGSSDTALTIAKGAAAPGVTQAARGDVARVPLNDVEALQALVADRGDRLAAIVLDLLPNYAGLVRVTDAFATAARNAADATGALLIYDEVISFRMSPGGLQAEFPVTPDVTVLGKAIGGGLPIGAVLGSSQVMAAFDPFGDGAVDGSGTFSGNPVSVNAGLACLERFGAGEIAAINDLGARLRERLADGLPDPWTVRGSGSLVRVLVPGAPVGLARTLWWSAYERGALLMPTGMMALATPMSIALVDELAEIVIDAARAAATA